MTTGSDPHWSEELEWLERDKELNPPEWWANWEWNKLQEFGNEEYRSGTHQGQEGI